MSDARLEVTDALGRRIVPVSKTQFEIGRRETNDLRLAGSEVSRDHAEIAVDNNRFVLRDRNSRYGTYVNGEQVTERALVHGDRIRLGRTGGAEMVFLLADSQPPVDRATTTAVGDLRQIAALLEGLRALGSGRVLDDVLALVMDSAIDVSGAERGFIMLAGEGDDLEFKMARGRGHTTLSGVSFATSRKIPEEVFRTGQARIVADLLDGELASMHMHTVALGVRNVLCVPLRLVRYVDKAEAAIGEERRIGVLYLDSKEKGSLLSGSTRAALETLATEAAVAIENARLYRETMEKARMEQEMRIAAEIQQALLPKSGRVGSYFRAAAASIPCRSIGGDFYDYVDMPQGSLGFALGDVAGKGPPAALLSAMMQGIFAAQAASSDGPSQTIARVNLALYRRGIESRFVTLMYGVLDRDGNLTYCNAGHNPPLIISSSGSGSVRRLDRGGPIVGLFETATYEDETVHLVPGDWLIVFSDGVSEALSAAGDEYGEARIVACVQDNASLDPPRLLEALFTNVRDFARGAAQSDDITAMVLRYGT
jgi:serine phosphatase RsbU (regulator of sigma subunit)/pSer/pThr/pTyr-binding forkhead associated (FHA) protein